MVDRIVAGWWAADVQDGGRWVGGGRGGGSWVHWW